MISCSRPSEARLGHTRVTTTERYTHVAATQVQDAGNRMAAALWSEG
jgi:site-specific recombinase XerD